MLPSRSSLAGTKHGMLPSRRYSAVTVRLVETVHHLPHFLELLRLGCGLPLMLEPGAEFVRTAGRDQARFVAV